MLEPQHRVVERPSALGQSGRYNAAFQLARNSFARAHGTFGQAHWNSISTAAGSISIGCTVGRPRLTGTIWTVKAMSPVACPARRWLSTPVPDSR